MLDLSKRSRSGKFRLVTKFKKEKNNKNREVHSSLGAPGTCPHPSAALAGCVPFPRLLSPWAWASADPHHGLCRVLCLQLPIWAPVLFCHVLALVTP